MGVELFRKSALQTLSSPEQLDQTLKTASPRSWIALGAAGLVLGTVLLWSVFGVLPDSVSGEGIIIRNGGIFNIVASGNGVITDFPPLKVGDTVGKGQVLGQISQPALALQVESARDELKRLQLEATMIGNAMDAEQKTQDQFDRRQRTLQRDMILAKERQLAALQKIEQQQEAMFREGQVNGQHYEESRLATLSTQNDISNARRTYAQLTVAVLDNAERRNERLLNLHSRIEAARGKLQALELQLRLESVILSAFDGVVVELMAMQGDNILSGQPVLSVEVGQQKLEAMIYMPQQGHAKRILPGMAAQISPSDAARERFGYMVGKVVSVSKYPATEQGMMAVFNNANLVRELSKAGPPLAVLVEFVPDSRSASGYQWSTRAGRGLAVTSGTMASGTFIVEKYRPIGLLLPMLKQTVGL